MHVSKEILVILGSITTCDPGDIHDTIKVQSVCLPFLFVYVRR